ncbi:MAG: hypothetical protein GX633_03735, partial [Clostridiales bacterium]|nr:hypothetical protein [Clostridiales bacterium]
NQIGMSKEDLARETAKVFGFQRAGSQIEQLACAGIAAAADRGFAFISDDGRVSYCD